MNYKRFSGFTVDDGERERSFVLKKNFFVALVRYFIRIACNDDDL